MFVNFRDIGGLSVASGRLKKGYFYRSGQLAGIEASDEQSLVEEYRVHTIYDFRSQEEIEEQPDPTITTIKNERIDLLASTIKEDNVSLHQMMAQSENIDKAMFQTYKDLIHSSSAKAGYHRFLTEVLVSEGPVLFHCFAGKDRTGIAAALLLKIAGASEEQILQDYMETNEQRKEANAAILAQLAGTITKEQETAIRTALMVKEEYLLSAAEEIQTHFGSFSSYLKNGLALEDGYEDAFRRRFVE